MSIKLSKKALDIGYFCKTSHDTLRFWTKNLKTDHETPVNFNNDLTQFRYPSNRTIVKINKSKRKHKLSPTGYSNLVLASDDLGQQRNLVDPDGNHISFAPRSKNLIESSFTVNVNDLEAQCKFYTEIMEFERIKENLYRVGDCFIHVKKSNVKYSGHWVDLGFRYFTLHVKNVDEVFNQIVSRGAEIGEKPYAIGDIAKISFVRDPNGNWIEVAQRASLAGSWE